MKMIKLIIELPESVYKRCKNEVDKAEIYEIDPYKATIARGIPLEQARDEISGKETAEEGIITGLDIAINVIKSMDMKQGAEQDI